MKPEIKPGQVWQRHGRRMRILRTNDWTSFLLILSKREIHHLAPEWEVLTVSGSVIWVYEMSITNDYDLMFDS